MTNLDARPDELLCAAEPCRDVDVIEPRDVPLGGIRAMTVRRTLPARGRPFIGPWCFLDHYGPDEVAATGGMHVPPHPHTGLSTVSWLFRGEIEHRDSLGTHALVRPGELNLMTAGRGIAHSEVSTPATTILNGVQLWLALPPDRRGIDPSFRHYAAPARTDGGASWRVFLGALAGELSPVEVPSPTLAAELTLASNASTEVRLRPEFEHGVLIDTGAVEVNGMLTPPGRLVALPVGTTLLRLRAAPSGGRVLVIGGTPMEADLVMWWNFVGGSHEEIVEARRAWQREIGAETGGSAGDVASVGEYDVSLGDARADRSGTLASGSRFGAVPGYLGAPLPAPHLPGGRLKPRRM